MASEYAPSGAKTVVRAVERSNYGLGNWKPSGAIVEGFLVQL